MNDDAFETRLRENLRRGGRPDPTPAWKESILERALATSRQKKTPRLLPPRWLMVGWAAAGVAALVLKWGSPATDDATAFASGQVPAEPFLPSLYAYQEQLRHFEQP